MKTKIIAAGVLSAAAIILSGCGQSNDDSQLSLLLLMSSNDSIADMSQSSLEAVTDGMSDINSSGASDVSFRMPCPAAWPERTGIRKSMMMAQGAFLRAISAGAATVSCPGGGSVDVTDTGATWGNSSATDFYVARTFNNCEGPYGFISVSGSGLIHWSGMNTGTTGVSKLKDGSVLDQAPVNKRFTRVATGDYVTTEGNGSSITDGTLTGNIAHTINWTAVEATTRSFTMTTDLTRRGYRASGSQVFAHNLSTPAPLAVTVDMSAGTRTLSGSIEVEYALRNLTVTTTFSSLVIPIDDCVPSSGSATIVISGAGDGNGTITYNGDGTANYTYTYTSRRGRTRSGSGTFTVSGCQ